MLTCAAPQVQAGIGMGDPVQSSWMNPAKPHAGQAIELDERYSHLIARSPESRIHTVTHQVV